jgi:sigma-E factor negative regulatory protein RseA
MNEDRPSSERHGERDSQLSAMFDGELSAAECELLARRLTRDDALRGQWSRYALIGAAVRSERGVKLDDRVARRVQTAVTLEVSYGDGGTADLPAVARSGSVQSFEKGARVSAYERWLRISRPVLGAGIAAGVAVMSILWMRSPEIDGASLDNSAVVADVTTPESSQVTLVPETSTVAANLAPAPTAVRNVAGSGDYSTPAPSTQTTLAPPAHLANYVVAHSEYSGPLSRRLALSGLVGGELAADVAPANQPVAVKPETEKRIASDAP